MLFKIGDTVYDPNEIPCAVVFDNYEEKQRMSKVIEGIKPHEIRLNQGEAQEAKLIEDYYWFTVNPKGHFTAEGFDKWAVIEK